jgi:hypothetical protein
MDFGNAVAGFLRENQVLILGCLSALTVALLVMSLCLAHKVRKLGRKALGVVDGETGRLLRDELAECTRDLSTVSGDLANVQQQQTDLKAQQRFCVQRVGMVRFNAFEDVGGEQSFALALLDENHTGVVLSSLLSRSDCRMYAKPVTSGASEHNLSQEEQDAVRKAAQR